jgi:hypothetical protein
MAEVPIEVVLEVTRWLMLKERPPGMVGRVSAFSGRTVNGEAKLTRSESVWGLVEAGTEVSEHGDADVIRLVAEGHFRPSHVEVVPDLAALLFQQAVSEAEATLPHLQKAAEAVDEMGTTGKTLMPFVLGGAALDRTVRSAITSIILSIAAGEAQVNAWAEERGGWSEDEDKLSMDRKCKALAQPSGRPLDLGKSPLQDLADAVRVRNRLVHSTPIPEPFPLTGPRAAVPGRSTSVAARKSCLAVRQSLLAVAVATGRVVPGYLAYCPPGDPERDEVWTGATLLTGTRDDPEFPTAT